MPPLRPGECIVNGIYVQSLDDAFGVDADSGSDADDDSGDVRDRDASFDAHPGGDGGSADGLCVPPSAPPACAFAACEERQPAPSPWRTDADGSAPSTRRP